MSDSRLYLWNHFIPSLATPPVFHFHSGIFKPVLFHPNVFDSGHVCLSILKEHEGWKPSLTVKQVLLGIQDLLTDPNPRSPANQQANHLFL